MTVNATYAPVQYQGNGATTAFAFPYAFFTPSDVVVTLYDSVAQTNVSGVTLGGSGTYGYTVTGTQDVNTGEYLSGGTITFNTAPLGTYEVVLGRAVSATQPVSLTNNAPFPAKTLEGALDRLTMLVQQVISALSYALCLPTSDTTLSSTLPPAAQRANMGLMFDSSGNPVVGTLAAGNIVSSAMVPVLQASTTAAAAAAMGVATLNAPTLTNPVVGTQTAGDNSTKAASTAFTQTAATAMAKSAVAAAASSFKNRLINGSFAIDQRNSGAAQALTAGAALAYTVDRWFAYCTGANVTGQRVAGSAPNQYLYQFTGAASVTGVGIGQRIEAANSFDLAGSNAELSVLLATSAAQTVTWTAYYATTSDTFGSLASPTKTQIATGSFNTTAALTQYSTTIAIPAGATTGIEIDFSIGALGASATWTLGSAQLEPGSAVTAFERRSIGQELSLSQRYFWQTTGTMTVASGVPNGIGLTATYPIWFPSTMRAIPTILAVYVSNQNATSYGTQNVKNSGLEFYALASGSGGVVTATWSSITASAEI